MLGFLLVVVVLATATDDRAISAGAGLAIGFIIGAEIYVALAVLGGSFNAARTLGPMIVAGQFPLLVGVCRGPHGRRRARGVVL